MNDEKPQKLDGMKMNDEKPPSQTLALFYKRTILSDPPGWALGVFFILV